MIFWTVVFITYYLAALTRGNLYYGVFQKVGELTLKQAIAETKKEKDEIAMEMLKSSWTLFLGIPIMIIMYIYLFNAMNVDVYKYPTIIMLFYAILITFVFRKKQNKNDLNTEEGRMRYKIELEKTKRYTFRGFISQIGFLTYFGYMFYLLVLR